MKITAATLREKLTSIGVDPDGSIGKLAMEMFDDCLAANESENTSHNDPPVQEPEPS